MRFTGTSPIEKSLEALGAPFFATKDCLIYNADCLAAMDLLEPESIDLTVTSPPYNIGKEYEQPMPLEDYIEWSAAWTKRVYDVTAPDGSFWLNLGYVPIRDRGKAVPLPYVLWSVVPFYMIQEIVWQYGAGVAGRRFFSPRNEKFIWYVKDPDEYTFNLDDVRDPNVKYPNQKKNGRLKVNPMGKNPGDVWYVAKVTSGASRASPERTPHPAQFPSALIERVIKASSNPGDVILDPFLGSGTTAEVAIRLGRRVIGFELDDGYCKIAAERTQRAIEQITAEQQRISLF